MGSFTERNRVCTEFSDSIDLLLEIPFFSVMPLDAVKVLACLSVCETFLAGDTLFAQDEIDDHAYYILGGEAELLLRAAEKEEKLRSFGKGDFIGGLSLVSTTKRLFSLRAKTDLKCLILSNEQFQKTLAQFPEAAGRILKELSLSVHQWEYRLLHGHGRLCEECKKGVGVTLL